MSSYQGRVLHVTSREEAMSMAKGLEQLLQYGPLFLGPLVVGIVLWSNRRKRRQQAE